MDELLIAAPILNVQLLLWLIHTLAWYLICTHIAYPIIVRFIENMERKDQYVQVTCEVFKKGFGIDISEGNKPIEVIARVNACLVQHAIGGLMASFSAFGITLGFIEPRIAFALARHGNLCELGCETQDVIIRFSEICFGGELGRKKNPFTLVALMCVHHSASLCMVLPVNLYYPENKDAHELSCILQFAACAAMFLQQYGYTLDVKQVQDLMKMKITVTVSFVIMFWSRITRFFPLVWSLLVTFRQDGNWFLFKLSLIPAVCLTLFNVILVVEVTNKLIKFLPRIVKDDASKAASGTVLGKTTSYFVFCSRFEEEWAKIMEMLKSGLFYATQKHKTE